MKKRILFLFLTVVLFLSASARAQTGQGTGSSVNQASGGPLVSYLGTQIGTVATMLAISNPTPGKLFSVTNGASATDCSAGGGTTPSLCVYNGVSMTWISFSGGGGGVTSITIAGTPNQIAVAGTCMVTSTGTCTVSITNSPTLPGTTTATLSSTSAAATQAAGDNTTAPATDQFVTTAVNNAIAGVNPAVAVLAASTASQTGTYSNGTAGVGATFTITATGTYSLDGVAINTIGQRILLKNQSSGFQNGIYTATIVGAVAVSAVFTRATDYNSSSNINSTGAIPVQSGTVNTTTSWLLTSTVTTVGTDSLTYSQFSINPANAGTLTSVATTAPLGGGTITTSGTLTCATCATTTNGGALSGTSPVAISAAGAISLSGGAGQIPNGASGAFTATPSLGTDNSVAGTLQISNSAANAHTIWSSGATTTNTIAGFATVPTTGHIVDCTVSSTTCTLHDSGVVTANVVNASSPGVGIGHFAGSTQTLTSSLIVAADITSGTITGTQLASSLSLTTPNINAATGTSLLATGIVDGTVPVGISTGTSCTLGTSSSCTSVAYNHAYQFNQEATAGTGVTYTLPATAVGKQYCVANSGTTGVVNTGVLTVYPPASSYIIYNGVVNTVGGGGTHGIASAGAAGDGACFVAIDATHWQVYAQSGTWTEN